MTEQLPLKFGLYVTATPIGNLGDMTFRAVSAMKSADAILCEDTRVTSKLLAAYEIQKPLIPFHEHNAGKAIPGILKRLEKKEVLVLVSDAGTPLVSDPGYRLVKEARGLGIPVFPLPGASALLAALMAAGLPTDKFCFEGFLPSKKAARRNALEKLKSEKATRVFFESPNRVKKTLGDMCDVFGPEREVAFCRELTKKFEEIVTLPLGELLKHVEEKDTIKGEIVLLLAPDPKPEEKKTRDADLDAMLEKALETLSVREAAQAVAFVTGKRRKVLYERALKIKGKK